MAEGVWKGVYPLVFGQSKQLSLNKIFDPSTPSRRKGRDGEKRKKKREKTDRHLSRPRPPFWGPLAAILDFAGSAALQAVSERPLRR